MWQWIFVLGGGSIEAAEIAAGPPTAIRLGHHVEGDAQGEEEGLIIPMAAILANSSFATVNLSPKSGLARAESGDPLVGMA